VVKKIQEHHPKNLRQTRNDLAAGESALHGIREEPDYLGLLQIALFDGGRGPADGRSPLGGVLCHQMLHSHPQRKKLAVEVSSNGKKREAVRARKKKKWWQWSSTCKVKVNEKGFPLKYASVKEVGGRDVARNVEAAAHSRARKLAIYRATHICAGQCQIKSPKSHVCRP
jgi:hypothetical protein